MLEDSKKWNFPPSPWEAAICAELRNQIPQAVPVAPADQLALMGMRANECHANARWYAKNDPAGKIRFITGWWVQWPNFVLHSVIEQDGQLICITPNAFGETAIQFIADPTIGWVEDGEVYSAIRDGRVIGVGVRAVPEFTVAQTKLVCELLVAGVNPFNACDMADEKLKELGQRLFIGEDAISPKVGIRGMLGYKHRGTE
jgi:hypothetical protein